MNARKTITSIAITAMMVAMVFAAIAVPASAQVEVQIGMAIDGSGSIGGTEWTTIINGVADAVDDSECVPHDGTVELTVVQFAGNGATLEVGPVVITAANATTVANDIRNIVQGGSTTPMAHGIHLLADTMNASANFDAGIKQVINIATDGVPNVVDSGMGGTNGTTSAVLARDYAITTLEMTPEDEIDAEGIGINEDNRNWLKDNIVSPQPGSIATLGDPDSYIPGWVCVVADAQEFAESMCEKFRVIIDEPCCPDVPVGPGPSGVTGVPILTPLGAVALIGLLAIAGVGGIRRRRT